MDLEEQKAEYRRITDPINAHDTMIVDEARLRLELAIADPDWLMEYDRELLDALIDMERP